MSDDNISSEEDEKRYIALPALKCRSKPAILLKHRRQKFSAKWTSAFTWLKPDNVDESIGFCTVCDKRLVCKKSHLERHENSFKHQRVSMRSDNDANNGDDTQETTVPEFLECDKQEPLEEDDEFDHAIELDPDYSLDYETDPPKRIKHESSKQSKESAITHLNAISNKKTKTRTKLNRIKLLKRIDRDRQELNEYYYARQKQSSPTPPSTPHQQYQQQQKHVKIHSRDSFDLFFDSMSASVKTLPPKLAAEVKIRVSQIVAEFELRAICEREALEHSGNIIDDSTMVVASTTSQDVDDVALPTQETTTVTTVAGAQILYTFQPK